jgi:tRNA A37 threonylcarbamoyladenosine dehydratase
MSLKLISRNPDLKRLQDEGYEVEVRNQSLLVNSVPYLDSAGRLCRGTLVSELTLAGDQTARPSSHVAHFAGSHPCLKDGRPIPAIQHSSERKQLGADLFVDHMFSNKPKNGYMDYFEKMTTYIAIISGPAMSIHPDVTPRTFRTISSTDEDSVFHYLDTASSRAGIDAVVQNFVGRKVGIIGLGGTGAYVLDLVAKTPVLEIHLYDGDTMLQHNAFRTPGAASIEDLQRQSLKVEYFRAIYSRMRKNIFAHPTYVDANTTEALDSLTFVFICIDDNESRRVIVERLEAMGVPFIDVGMGVQLVNDTLIGQVRTTASTEQFRGPARLRMPRAESRVDNDYVTNIQIADLNALNAALAVIKWKKLAGFYQDLEEEYNATYAINVNALISDKVA